MDIKLWCWNKKYVLCKDENDNYGAIPIKIWKKAVKIFDTFEID